MSDVCCEHEHKVWSYAHDTDWQVRVLTKRLIRTRKRARAERSRFVWDGPEFGVYTLSPLGILHGLFGVIVWIEG